MLDIEVRITVQGSLAGTDDQVLKTLIDVVAYREFAGSGDLDGAVDEAHRKAEAALSA